MPQNIITPELVKSMAKRADGAKCYKVCVLEKCKCSHCGLFVDIQEFTALNAIDEFLDMKLTGIIFTHFDKYGIGQMYQNIN